MRAKNHKEFYAKLFLKMLKWLKWCLKAEEMVCDRVACRANVIFMLLV